MRIFETDAACFFLYCYFFFTSIGLCLHAHPKPKLKGLYLHIFGNQVELHVFLTHFFQKKKKRLTWNKWNSDFYTIKCPRQNKCVRQLWDTDFIVWPYYRLFSLAWIFWSNLVLPPKCVSTWNNCMVKQTCLCTLKSQKGVVALASRAASPFTPWWGIEDCGPD